MKVREEMAMAVQDMMYDWLHEVSDMKRRIAVFDATNTTISRRLKLANRAKKENVSLLFVESICDDQSVLTRNYDLKLHNEDYKNTDPEEARADFLRRVAEYEKVYEVGGEENTVSTTTVTKWNIVNNLSIILSPFCLDLT